MVGQPEGTTLTAPFRGSFGISSQDAQVKGSRSEHLQKTIHGGPVSMEANRQAAFQGGRSDKTICATSRCTHETYVTDEHPSVWAGGNSSSDSEREGEGCSS